MEALTEIEKLCEKQIEKHELGTDLWGGYLAARTKVFEELLPYIKKSEPFLSDHGPKHITNVFKNAFDLLGKELCTGKGGKDSLDATELYFLVLSILFHDVGNVFTRKGHKSRLREAYEFARGADQSLLPERQLMFKIVEAHGGLTSKGSPDTIGPLERNGVFRSKRVDCQRVAAILRMADELAEGPQRTSLFMQKHFPYPADSQVFHDYATICSVHISREHGRLALVYHIETMPDLWGTQFDAVRLKALLEFCYQRIMKMDLERKYTRHYCSMLMAFKQTEVSFHFHRQNQDMGLELQKIVLNDLVMPNDMGPDRITRDYPAYKIDDLMKRLQDYGAHASV